MMCPEHRRRLVALLMLWIGMAGAALPLPAFADATLYEPDVARIEARAESDPEGARTAAEALKARIEESIETELGFADEAAEHARQLRDLAASARSLVQTSLERATRYDREARDPLLSERTQDLMRQEAANQRREAEIDEARAKEREQEAARRQQEAEQLRDKAVLMTEQVARLDRILSPDAEAETAAEPDATGAGSGTGDTPATGEALEDDPLVFDVYEMLGMWTDADDAFDLVIVQKDPDTPVNPYRLEAHSRNRIWEGQYTGLPPGHAGRTQNSRIEFRYTPRADEMNPEIPEWAREELAGKLIWRLEIDEAGTEIDPLLSVKWYRGEVHWTEGTDGQRVWIDGDGVPLVFELHPQVALQLAELAGPTITIQLASDINYDPTINPIEALLKGQRFFVRVTVPIEMAREIGRTITVDLRGLTGKDTEAIELTAGAMVGLKPVTYAHGEAVAIADCSLLARPARNPQIMSIAWIFGVAGDCLDLNVKDGEIVEFSYDDVYQQVLVYNSWVQRGIAMHREGVDRLEIVYRSIQQGDYTAAQKDAAGIRLQMLANYRQLLAIDKITDLHRYELGELYLGMDRGPGRFIAITRSDATDSTDAPVADLTSAGLIGLTDAQIAKYYEYIQRYPPAPPSDPSWFNPLMKAYLEGLTGEDLTPDAHTAADDPGIAWTSPAEAMFVRTALFQLSQELLNSFTRTTIENFSFGLYQGYVTALPGGDLYLVVTGTDHWGTSRPTWERVLAGVGLASGAILTLADINPRALVATDIWRARVGSGQLRYSTILPSGSSGIRVVDDLAEIPDLPPSLKQIQREQTMLRVTSDTIDDAPTSCVMKNADRPIAATIMTQRAVDDSADFAAELIYMERAYGPDAKMVDPFDDKLLPTQTRPTCNEVASNYAILKGTGRRVAEDEGQVLIDQIMVEQLANAPRPYQRGTRGVRDLLRGDGYLGGFDQLAVRDYLRHFGAKVAEIDRGWNRMIKMRHIWSALERGYIVKIVLELGPQFGRDAFHAVIIDGLKINRSTGRIVGVRIFDPNIGRLIDVPAPKFKDMLARNITAYGILTLIKF
ncbi:MAG: hypothetical protein WEC00_09720 [Dongiaceae bacterium]